MGLFDKLFGGKKKEEIEAKESARKHAKDWWNSSASLHSHERGYAVCDLCGGNNIPIGEGYLLEGRELLKTSYLSAASEQQRGTWELLNAPEEEMILQLQNRLISSPSEKWLFCEECIKKVLEG